jgi:hypothetical protein
MDPRVLDAMMPYMTGKLNKFKKKQRFKVTMGLF